MGFRRVNYFISMKGDRRFWLLYQLSHICMGISWLLLHPVALSCGAGENLGILMVLKHSATDPCISIFIGVKPFWGCPSCPAAYYCRELLSLPTLACFNYAGSPAKAEPALYSSMSVCPSTPATRPGWCSAALCVPMATAQPLCSALGNFPLSRPPPCNKLSQSGFPAQPLAGVGTGLGLPCSPAPVWGIGMPTPRTRHIS